MRTRFLLLGVALALPAPVDARQATPLDVSDGWRVVRVEADAPWPASDPAAWEEADIRAPWSALGGSRSGEAVWYVRDVEWSGPDAGELSVLLGAMSWGRYEVYADGRRIGSHGAPDRGPPVADPRLFAIPASAAADGRVALAIRAVPATWSEALGGERGGFGGALVGPTAELELAAERTSLRRTVDAVPLLLFGTVALLLGLFQLLVYASRRDRPNVWFGLGSIAFAANALALTPWGLRLAPDFAAALRLNDASGHVAAAFLLLFLFDAVGRRVPRLMSWYILSHGFLAVFVAAAPLGPLVATTRVRLLWLVPALAAALWLVAGAVRRRHPVAWPLAAGVAAVVLGQLGEMARVAGAPLPQGLPYVGFGATLVSLAFALSLRFNRVHEELDGLRADLERQVAERTAAFADMTERARVANEAKTHFLARMSHELRTPLNSVIGFSNVLSKRIGADLEPKNAHLLDRIHSSGVHLLDLVNDLLDVSSIEAGQVRLEFTEVPLERLVSGVLAELGPQAVAKEVRLTALVPSPLAPITTDRVRLKQILTNLVGNAVKFSDGGRVTVTVHHDERTPTAIEVADEGPGIPADFLPRLFQPFTQGDGSTRRTHDGAGLGLAISQALCDLLDYRIQAHSTLGEGTVMTVHLRPDAPDRPPPDARPRPAVHRLSPTRPSRMVDLGLGTGPDREPPA